MTPTLLDYRHVPPGFELLLPRAPEDDVGRFWNLWFNTTLSDDPEKWDDETRLVNRMQETLGEVSADHRLIRAQMAGFCRTKPLFPRSVELLCEEIGVGRFCQPARLGCEGRELLKSLGYEPPESVETSRYDLFARYRRAIAGWMAEESPGSPFDAKVLGFLGSPDDAKRGLADRLLAAIDPAAPSIVAPKRALQALCREAHSEQVFEIPGRPWSCFACQGCSTDDPGLRCECSYGLLIDAALLCIGAPDGAQSLSEAPRRFIQESILAYCLAINTWLLGAPTEPVTALVETRFIAGGLAVRLAEGVHAALGARDETKVWLATCLLKTLKSNQRWHKRTELVDEFREATSWFGGGRLGITAAGEGEGGADPGWFADRRGYRRGLHAFVMTLARSRAMCSGCTCRASIDSASMHFMQADQERDLKSTLRASPKPVILLLALPAVLLTLAAFNLPHPIASMALAACLYVAIAMLWALTDRKLELGTYATIAVYLAAVGGGAAVVNAPDLSMLGCLVTAMAAALGGAPAAACTGGIQALVLVGLGAAGIVPWTLVALGLALNAGALVAVLAIMQPVRTLAYWSYERYDRARTLLDEARDRQAELKQALEDLAHANRELALAHDRVAALRLMAEDSRRTKLQFVSNVSHEFRAPLNIIIGLADILLDARQVYGHDLPAEAREDVAILQRNSRHLVDLINDVLDLSQIEANQLALRREWVDLGRILHNAAEIVRPLIASKGLSLEVSAPADLEPIYCDPRRIRQVVLNLVSNAARFTERGSVAIAARMDADDVVVSVQDTGPGISIEDVERIFEPFEQSGTAGAVLGRGSGLGLTISREFVKLHDGSIWVSSTPGMGSIFSFRLPVRPVAGPTAAANRWLTPSWSARGRSSRPAVPDLGDRVVVHDDTGRLAAALARYAGDFELVHAPERDAVAALCAQESVRAVVLCRDDGHALLSDVQALTDGLEGTPIIGIAIASAEAADPFGGAVDYIAKPVSAESLRRACSFAKAEPIKVLIVDDEADARHVLATQLRLLLRDVEIQEGASGAEALAAARAWHPDLVLLDVIMPAMDGWQTLAAFKARPELATVPVVMVSAQDRRPEPLTGSLIVATMQGGLTLGKLIASFRALSDLLLPHAGRPAADKPENRADSPAWPPPPPRQD